MSDVSTATGSGGRRRIVAVSHKTYLDYATTLSWLEAAAEGGRVEGGRAEELDVVVFPVAPALPAAVSLGAQGAFVVGAQDVSDRPAGAFTGELPAQLLAEMGVGYVEIGHAERRFLFAESAEVIGRKVQQSLAHGLVPLVCVGEGRLGDTNPIDAEQAVDLAGGQLAEVLPLLPYDCPVVVAYEPVWAIGAEEPAPVEHVRTVAAGLRSLLEPYEAARVIYGGTAGPGLFSQLSGAVDGLFLGRRAHDPGAFAEVLAEVASAS